MAVVAEVSSNGYMTSLAAGNLLTVVALLRCQKLRSHATTAFVISLAVSDLLFSAINLPLTASRYLQISNIMLIFQSKLNEL